MFSSSANVALFIYLVDSCRLAFSHNSVDTCGNKVCETVSQEKVTVAEMQGNQTYDVMEIPKHVYQALLANNLGYWS